MWKRLVIWFPWLLAVTWTVLAGAALRDISAFVAAVQSPRPVFAASGSEVLISAQRPHFEEEIVVTGSRIRPDGRTAMVTVAGKQKLMPPRAKPESENMKRSAPPTKPRACRQRGAALDSRCLTGGF